MTTTHVYPAMRRKDRQLTDDEALALLARAEVATISMNTPEGPYGVPISPVLIGKTLYFHSAMAGRKVELLRQGASVWISAFCDVTAATDKFTTYFESVMAAGMSHEVVDPEEKIGALRALCEKFTPANMAAFDQALQRSLPVTAVFAIALEHVTGKAKRRK